MHYLWLKRTFKRILLELKINTKKNSKNVIKKVHSRNLTPNKNEKKSSLKLKQVWVRKSDLHCLEVFKALKAKVSNSLGFDDGLP